MFSFYLLVMLVILLCFCSLYICIAFINFISVLVILVFKKNYALATHWKKSLNIKLNIIK